MIEKTIVIIKPNDSVTKNLKIDLMNQLEECQLKVISSNSVKLNEQILRNIWPIYFKDFITSAAYLKYFLNKVVEYYIIEGYDAIKKVIKIKENLRNRYSRSIFNNCLHSAKDSLEYISNLAVLQDEYIEKDLCLSTTINNWDKLNESSIPECIEAFWNMTFINVLEVFRTYGLELKQHERLIVIYEDQIHNLSDYAQAIYEVLEDKDISKAYSLATALICIGYLPVLNNNDKEKVNEKYKLLSKRGFEVILLDICQG